MAMHLIIQAGLSSKAGYHDAYPRIFPESLTELKRNDARFVTKTFMGKRIHPSKAFEEGEHSRDFELLESLRDGGILTDSLDAILRQAFDMGREFERKHGQSPSKAKKSPPR